MTRGVLEIWRSRGVCQSRWGRGGSAKRGFRCKGFEYKLTYNSLIRIGEPNECISRLPRHHRHSTLSTHFPRSPMLSHTPTPTPQHPHREQSTPRPCPWRPCRPSCTWASSTSCRSRSGTSRSTCRVLVSTLDI